MAKQLVIASFSLPPSLLLLSFHSASHAPLITRIHSPTAARFDRRRTDGKGKRRLRQRRRKTGNRGSGACRAVKRVSTSCHEKQERERERESVSNTGSKCGVLTDQPFLIFAENSLLRRNCCQRRGMRKRKESTSQHVIVCTAANDA